MANETKLDKTKKLTRNQARALRRAKRERRKRFWKTLAFVGIGIVAALLIIALFLPSGLSLNFSFGSSSGPGQQVKILGFDHIEVGQAHPPYNSSPPTSGWHYEAPAPWGVSETPIVDEVQIHNLEHGGIMLQYNCPEACPELVQQLTDAASGYKHTVVAPYPNMDARIALTAWGWIDKFNDFDQDRVLSFIKGHIDRGPEKVD